MSMNFMGKTRHFLTLNLTIRIVKVKAIPLEARTCAEDSRRLMVPDFKKIGTRSWQGCQPYAPTTFTTRKYSWYSFPIHIVTPAI